MTRRAMSSAHHRGLSLVTSSLMLAGLFAGCTPDIKEARLEGIRYYRGGEHIKSMATLRRALSQVHNDAQCNYYMGLNYRTLAAQKFDRGDYTAAYREIDWAVMYFTQAIKSWPNYMEAIAAKNEALEARGKYEAALNLAEDVTHTTRGYAADHFLYLGDEYMQRADFDNALRAYQTALEDKPNSSKAHAALGRLYERTRNFSKSIEHYERALQLNPREPGVEAALARVRGGARLSTE